MAWELQTDMAALIEPSVEAYLDKHETPSAEAGRILGYQRSEGETDIATLEAIQVTCDADVARLGLAWAVAAITEHAEAVATTSNGGWAVYLDEGGWCEVPFIDEEEGE